MIFLVVSSSILAILLTILCFSATLKTEIAKKQKLERMRAGSRYIDDELEKSFFQRYISPVWKRISANFIKRSPQSRKSSGKTNERNLRLENELRLAGIRLPAQEYIFLRIMGEVSLLVVGSAAALVFVDDTKMQLLILVLNTHNYDFDSEILY